MRPLLALALISAFACSAQAQEQEGKLLTRLLKPNTTLGSSEQNKKFTADHVSVDKHARVGTFYLQKKPDSKTYSNAHAFKANQFDVRPLENAGGTGNSLQAAHSTVETNAYSTPSARATAELRDSHKHVGGSDYTGNRPYLDKGKSQKSLDQKMKTKPMTIDEVRDLLNKSK